MGTWIKNVELVATVSIRYRNVINSIVELPCQGTHLLTQT